MHGSQEDAGIYRLPSHPWARLAKAISADVTLQNGSLAFNGTNGRSFSLDQIQAIHIGRIAGVTVIRFHFSVGPMTIVAADREIAIAFQEALKGQCTTLFLARAEAVAASWRGFLGQDRYLSHSELHAWESAQAKSEVPSVQILNSLGVSQTVQDSYQRLITTRENRNAQVLAHNEAFVTRELEDMAPFFNGIGHGLTQAQRRAVVINEDNNLIQAGAGTGKTETIVARARYLVERGIAKPEEILLLSFNNKAAREMEQRLQKVGLIGPTVSTLHALGNKVLVQSGQPIRSIVNDSNPNACADLVQLAIEGLSANNPKVKKDLVDFNLFWRFAMVPPHEFTSMAQYAAHVKAGNQETIAGERVRSREEVLVANYLTSMNVKYVYETVYRPKTDVKLGFRYLPDFYLPDYDLYLEHFALNKAGQAPNFMGGPKYVANAASKRALHASGGTILIESHSWHLYERDPVAILRSTLMKAGVQLSPHDPADLLAMANRREHEKTSELAKFVSQFNSLQKNGNLSPGILENRARTHRESKRCLKFLAIQGPLFDEYQRILAEKGAMDFDDMIFAATEVVRSQGLKGRYTQMLVDEFQDSSRGRAAFLLALRSQVEGCRLFCVGDDWQSIYRFAGSDVTCMTDFARLFGTTKETVLDRTFRFGEVIQSVSSEFITKNPGQSRKQFQAVPTPEPRPIKVIYESGNADGVARVLRQLFDSNTPAGTTVYVLARYNSVINEHRIRAYQKSFGSRLSITASSIHKAKGLEADYVIVDKLVGGNMGFPNDREDDALLDLVLGDQEAYPFSEERRLFYVALTRARLQTYLVTTAGDESDFVKEVVAMGEPRVSVEGYLPTVEVQCPSCQSGILVPKSGNSGSFYACSNFPACAYTEEPCPSCHIGVRRRIFTDKVCCSHCRAESPICPQCHRGILVTRRRNNSQATFLGCSMYTSELYPCRYTRNA